MHKMRKSNTKAIKFVIPGDEYREQFKEIIKYMFDDDELYDAYGYSYLDWHEQLKIWDNRLDYFIVAATHRNKLVGFAILDLRKDLVAYIYNSFVLPGHRRFGIASFFKDRMEEEARKRGCIMIMSSVDKGNTASRKMNEKAGWLSKPSRIHHNVIWYFKDLRNEMDGNKRADV